MSKSPVPSEKLLLPRKLTAENGAKYALIGEFFEEIEIKLEDGDEVMQRVPVSWTTIKAIWDRAVDHFEALDKQERERMVSASEGSRKWWRPESVRFWLSAGADTVGRWQQRISRWASS